MTQELINSILAGELSPTQIAQRVAQLHDKNVEETDAMMDRIEALEEVEALQQSTIKDIKERFSKAVQKCGEQDFRIKVLEKEGKKAIAQAKAYMNDLTIVNAKLKLTETDQKEVKRLKTRMKRLTAANQSHQKGRKVIKQRIADLKEQLSLMQRENAKLRMTGHKQVGKYNFTIFPVKVDTEVGDRKVGLAVYNNEGAMKVLTRSSVDGEIVQPKSHHFRFDKDTSEWIHNFFDVADAHEHKFTDPLLRLVN
jgi:myosin heavy subunit